MKKLSLFLWLCSSVLLGSGYYFPLFKTTHFWFFSEDKKLVSTLKNLYATDEILLFAIIAFTTITIPVVKQLYYLYSLITNKKVSTWVQFLNKWAFVDVMVVSVLLVVFNTKSNITKIQIDIGLYCFIAYLITSNLLLFILNYKTQNSNKLFSI
jgi:uncharacterized paraquat-inducible protein A